MIFGAIGKLIDAIFGQPKEYVYEEPQTYQEKPCMDRMHRIPYLKANKQRIELIENLNAENPTYDALLDFLYDDDTEQIQYVDGVFTCGDFAELLHNRAERAGIRCGFVCVDFYENVVSHGLNAFMTEDYGLIFIDSTGSDKSYYEGVDCIVDMRVGKLYDPKPIFTDRTFNYRTYKTIRDFQIIWH